MLTYAIRVPEDTPINAISNFNDLLEGFSHGYSLDCENNDGTIVRKICTSFRDETYEYITIRTPDRRYAVRNIQLNMRGCIHGKEFTELDRTLWKRDYKGDTFKISFKSDLLLPQEVMKYIIEEFDVNEYTDLAVKDDDGIWRTVNWDGGIDSFSDEALGYKDEEGNAHLYPIIYRCDKDVKSYDRLIRSASAEGDWDEEGNYVHKVNVIPFDEFVAKSKEFEGNGETLHIEGVEYYAL